MNENAITEPVSTGKPTAESKTLTSFIGEDGSFKDGWRDSLPEEIRSEKIFDRVKNFEGAMRSLASAERMIGKDKIPIPNENSTQDEWDRFFKVGGRPEKADEYGFKRPEQLPEEYWDDNRAKKFQDVFHKAGISKKQSDAIIEAYNSDVLGELQTMQTNSKLAIEQAEAELVSKWGNQYQSKIHIGNAAIEKGITDEDHKQRLLQKFGNDPDFIEYSANLGGLFVESGAIPKPSTTGLTKQEIESEILKVQQSDAFLKRNHPEHNITIKKITDLYKKKASLTG